MTQARIICIGNPYRADDWVGPAVLAALRETRIAPDVEIVDGGLLGLNLLPLLESVERVVFADTLLPGEDDAYLEATVIESPSRTPSTAIFDHAGGLSYLLRAAPLVIDPMPRVWIIGAAAAAQHDVVPTLAAIALELTNEH